MREGRGIEKRKREKAEKLYERGQVFREVEKAGRGLTGDHDAEHLNHETNALVPCDDSVSL